MMQKHLTRRARLAAGVAVVLAAGMVGCSRENPVAPAMDQGSALGGRNGMHQDGVVSGTFAASGWTVVASKSIDSKGGTVTGSRYTLTIPYRALKSATTVTISEKASGILDAEFGPAGLKFDKPVTLVMNYAGTNADPSSPSYDGTVPAYYQYDASTGSWSSLPGTLNTVARTFTVQINFFNPASGNSGGSIIEGQYARLPPGDGTGDW